MPLPTSLLCVFGRTRPTFQPAAVIDERQRQGMGADVGRQRRVVIGQPAVGTEHEDAMGVEANGAVAAAQGELGANDRLVALMVPGHALDDEAEVWSDAEPIEIRLHQRIYLLCARAVQPQVRYGCLVREPRGDGVAVEDLTTRQLAHEPVMVPAAEELLVDLEVRLADILERRRVLWCVVGRAREERAHDGSGLRFR